MHDHQLRGRIDGAGGDKSVGRGVRTVSVCGSCGLSGVKQAQVRVVNCNETVGGIERFFGIV